MLPKFSYQRMGLCVDKSDAIRENGNKRIGWSITDFSEDREKKRTLPPPLVGFLNLYVFQFTGSKNETFPPQI